jgi:hypothetical protein
MRTDGVLRPLALAALVAAFFACSPDADRGSDPSGSRAATPAAGPGSPESPRDAAGTAVPSPKIRLASGVEIQDLVLGTGDPLEQGQTAVCHATGWLADGRQFWSTIGGDPVPMLLAPRTVIPGFLEGVTGMRIGGKRKIWIPSELGYGKLNQPKIPADSDLVYEVELIGVK